EAFLPMTSLEPFPIVVRLQQGVPYQFVFIGSELSSRIIMELFDGRNRKIEEKIERGGNNNILYRFTPATTDNYLITLIQKKGTNGMCDYFGILTTPTAASSPVSSGKPSAPRPEPAIPPATPARPANLPPAPPPAAYEKPRNSEEKFGMPANQIPNQNRLKATREAQEKSK